MQKTGHLPIAPPAEAAIGMFLKGHVAMHRPGRRIGLWRVQQGEIIWVGRMQNCGSILWLRMPPQNLVKRRSHFLPTARRTLNQQPVNRDGLGRVAIIQIVAGQHPV